MRAPRAIGASRKGCLRDQCRPKRCCRPRRSPYARPARTPVAAPGRDDLAALAMVLFVLVVPIVIYNVEQLWPDAVTLDHQLDTLHERFELESGAGQR